MEKRNRSNFRNVRCKIVGLAEAIKYAKRKKKQALNVKNNWHDESKSLGQEARYLLVAYGLLRGLPYRKIELKTHPEKKIDAKRLHDAIVNISAWIAKKEWTLEAVEKEIAL